MKTERGNAEIRGHSLYLERRGPRTGTPVVLLHHGLGSVAAWRAVAPPLAAAGYRVLAYDRWGYGRSGARHNLDIPGFTADLDDLSALLSAEEIERPVLVGHSDGGTIALMWAARHPDRTRALVSIAAHAYVEPKMEEGIEGIRRRWDADPEFRAGLRRVHGAVAEEMVMRWIDAWDRPANRGWDIRDQLTSVEAPALVIQGGQDEHALPDHARSIARSLPDGRLWLPERAGHMLPQEMPGPFTARLLSFLRETLPGEAPSGT